jgi:hypothetical protein
MGNKRKKGSMTPQKINNHKIEDFMDSEGDDSSADGVRMTRRMFNYLKEKLKEYKQKQLNESPKTQIKNQKSQK